MEEAPGSAYLARVVFAVQAAPSKSEQVFSAAGNILKPMRSSLIPEKLEDLVIIKLNVRPGALTRGTDICVKFYIQFVSNFSVIICIVLKYFISFYF